MIKRVKRGRLSKRSHLSSDSNNDDDNTPKVRSRSATPNPKRSTRKRLFGINIEKNLRPTKLETYNTRTIRKTKLFLNRCKMVFNVQLNTYFITEECYTYAVSNVNATTFRNWNSYLYDVGEIYRN